MSAPVSCALNSRLVSTYTVCFNGCGLVFGQCPRNGAVGSHVDLVSLVIIWVSVTIENHLIYRNELLIHLTWLIHIVRVIYVPDIKGLGSAYRALCTPQPY